MSETEKCRKRLACWCIGNGLDLGYGGDPIIPTAITVDLTEPYTHVGKHPQNLMGDASNLYWFKDNSLDYVFSSHLLEDFVDTEKVLREWLRVLKLDGRLILYCPIEQKYRKHCLETHQPYNQSHKIENFDFYYVKDILQNKIKNVTFVYQVDSIDIYSFEMVVQKGVSGSM
jgi:predicted SAM-dependent methyltransferase